MRIYDVYKQPVLVTRESAHAVRNLLAVSDDEEDGSVLDFTGVEAITPSFFDELVGEIIISFAQRPGSKVTLANVPTHLSTKYEAVARGRRVKIAEPVPGHWEI